VLSRSRDPLDPLQPCGRLVAVGRELDASAPDPRPPVGKPVERGIGVSVAAQAARTRDDPRAPRPLTRAQLGWEARAGLPGAARGRRCRPDLGLPSRRLRDTHREEATSPPRHYLEEAMRNEWA